MSPTMNQTSEILPIVIKNLLKVHIEHSVQCIINSISHTFTIFCSKLMSIFNSWLNIKYLIKFFNYFKKKFFSLVLFNHKLLCTHLGSSSNMRTWLTPDDLQPYTLIPIRNMNKIQSSGPRYRRSTTANSSLQ